MSLDPKRLLQNLLLLFMVALCVGAGLLVAQLMDRYWP